MKVTDKNPPPLHFHRPFPPKLQQAWDRLKTDQSAVTKKLKSMKFNYVSCCLFLPKPCLNCSWLAL